MSDEHPRHVEASFQTDVYLCSIPASIPVLKLRPFCFRGFAAADEPHLLFQDTFVQGSPGSILSQPK